MKFCKAFLEKVVIAGLLGIGFMVPEIWFLGLVGGSWYLFRLLADEYSYGDSYLIWLGKSLILTSWVWAVYPIDWLTIPLGAYELPLIGFYWLTVALSLALGGLVFHRLVRMLQKENRRRFLVYFIPMFWVVAELFGSLFFSLLMHGPGGTIGVNFSMGYTGYLLMEHPWLAWVAHIAGVYGLSLLFGVMIVCGRWLYVWRQRMVLVAVVVLLTVTHFLPIKTGTPANDAQYTVVHIDTYFNAPDLSDETSKAATRSDLVQAVEVAEAIDPDYIVLPEDANLFQQQINQTTLPDLLRFLYGSTSTVIVDSGRVDYGNGDVIQAALYDGGGDQLYQSHKRYLVPQGEYMPAMYRFLLGLFDNNDVTELLNERLDLVVGSNTSQVEYNDNLPGVLFCFEVVDPLAVRTLIAERKSVPFIAHIVSHSWINESPAFRHQLEVMLKTQAIWNDVPIVVAGNEYPGFLVTPSGAVKQSEKIAQGEKWEVGVFRLPIR